MSALDGVFRRHWGPAVATLARWSGDLSIAEDAVQEACAEAVDAWSRDGMPDNPGAWLVRVARNRALDRIRRESLRPGKEFAAVLDDIRTRTERTPPPHPVRDDELRMMFTCAHPALDRVSQLALTLRLISGLSVAEIARALLQTEAAVGQRITRAKSKIRQANIPLRVPPPHMLPERTEHVLSCIYSVFTEGYWSTAGPSAIRDDLCDEAVRISAELCALLPDSRDAQALAALILLHDSRRDSRVDRDGALIPLDEQDRRAWSRSKITRGLQHLQNAAGAAGPYLPQAVIAAVHATAPAWQSTDWDTICIAYDRVIDLTDSPVARANRALAIGFRDDFAAGLAALDAVADDPRLARSSTVASIRADLLRRAGRFSEAARCYEQALAVSGSAPARAFLRRRRDLCRQIGAAAGDAVSGRTTAERRTTAEP
ncbi:MULTISPECIES: RNA polymerase sigma factor [Mycobacteriaceae]|uniref:Sigma-70 family RNA polymerase sigma factor n=1 Tax=Mycolicibacterium parafortuitum TaxID=39692 RepID=A0ACC6MM37_MYCPF|nr:MULTISPECIES: sigma-70 family RNA polymerase sigma factor [Mycobacteriaceae]MBX7447086.1 sigma-70 family RNA polymerase sigma factor [Mycolicibacterium aurantiacum]MDZ5087998.1 sigma-70 family RNA polymerase sigma factor [Mycolicibacterium parafortuitum]GFM16267.1 RNA polymerase sigma factor, sigma-70 family [Mycobacterium sp. PO1]GFM25861.1 RNA polymerase sigma factor, sigma-70 family [Mycobacterium sp. PO2]